MRLLLCFFILLGSLHAADDPKLAVELTLERSTVVSGEPVSAKVRITNSGEKDFIYAKQGDFIANTDIAIKTPDGKQVPHLMACWVYGVPIISKLNLGVIHPSASIKGSANLGRIHDLKPGNYTVIATVNQPYGKEMGLVPAKAESNTVQLRVKELKIDAIDSQETDDSQYSLIICDGELLFGQLYKKLKSTSWGVVYLGVQRTTLEGITWKMDPELSVKVPESDGKFSLISLKGDVVKILTGQALPGKL